MRNLLLLSLLLLVASCKETNRQETQKQEVKVAYAEKTDKGNERIYTFLLEPYRKTLLSFRVGGPVTTFNVQNGQFFKKGELIAAIDDRDFIIRKEKAKALFNQAKADYVRITNLYEKGNISGASYEKAKADYEQAKADLNTASNQLRDTRLVAPFDGYVQKVNIDKYQDVNPSYPVLSFIDISKVKAEVYVPEDMAISLRTQTGKNSSYVCFNAIGNKKFFPKESYITQTTSENNISYLFTVILDNQDNSLLGGMTGTLVIPRPESPTQIAQGQMSIPQSAVCHNPQLGTYVWLVDKNSKVSRHPVSIGNLLADNAVEVLDGLDWGDQVALTGLSTLSDQQEVIVKK